MRASPWAVRSQGLGSASGLVLTNDNTDSTSILANAIGFTMNTPVPYGAPYDVAVAQNPPTMRCTVAQGSSTMPANNVNSVAVTCASTPVFAFVSNFYDSTVSAYSVDPSTGALTPIAEAPLPQEAIPYSVVVNPAGTFRVHGEQFGRYRIGLYHRWHHGRVDARYRQPPSRREAPRFP